MFIEEEKVNSICAFPPDGLLLSVDPANFLVVRNWEVIHFIKDPVQGNRSKNWQTMVPFFDIDEYPFCVSSGLVSYSLVNVKTGKLQTLANGRP